MKKIVNLGMTLLFLIAVGTASCELSIIQDGSGNGHLDADDVNTDELQITGTSTPQNLFSDFLEMVDQLESMTKAGIDTLADSELLRLGAPVQRATANTVFFDDDVMNNISDLVPRLTDNLQSLSQSEHSLTSNRIERILDQVSADDGYLNFRNAQDLRRILKNWASDADSSTACGDLFNHHDNFVVIGEGENFNIANYSCPAGTSFVLRSGLHTGQSVLSAKEDNKWVGLRNAIMDGEGTIYRGFSQGLNRNKLGWIELRNYHLHGIYSSNGSSGVLIKRMKFQDIAPDSTGQEYGAIYFENGSGITVAESSFEDVASAIRFRYSDGPLEVINNDALNTGRNFFQCGNCNGSGIRVSGNSLVRTDSYGITLLEDWINIFKSNGEPNDWIKVNNNRARGHSLSGSGSFIILGDYGGSYQEAIGNIGINPGQVGIGVAGGHHIKVQANMMYSAAWDSSNVAYYSANYSPSCGSHNFLGSESAPNNRAYWICGDSNDCNPPSLNHAWSDGLCDITNDEIREHVIVDQSLTPDIWNTWKRENEILTPTEN